MDFMASLLFLTTIALVSLTIFFRRMLVESVLSKHKKQYHPIAGTIFNKLQNFNRLHHYHTEISSKYKTYRLLSPFRNELHTTDPANIEYILKTNFANFGKGEYNYTMLKDLLGDGIFTVDGEKWRLQRKVASYEFSTKVLRNFSSVVFMKNADKLRHIISAAASSNQVIEIQDLLTKSTMDSIFEVGFGVELDNLNGSTEEGIAFTKAFDDCSVLTLWRYVDLTWKIKKFLNVGSEAKLKKNKQLIDSFVYKIINSKIKQVSASHDDLLVNKEDILSRFLQVEPDPRFLRDIILSFIVAGKDTTSAGLSWFFYMLCKHPLIQEKVAQEVREASGANDDTPYDEFVASINEKSLDKMHYLHAAITETLRLYPPLPADVRTCFSDDTLPDGFRINRGDKISYQIYAMGRMKYLWGDDAEAFQPERWLDKKGHFCHENPFKFAVFNAGPRICLGKDFANMQMNIFSAILLGCFQFKLSEEKRTVNYKIMLTLPIDGGLHLHAFHRFQPTNTTET